MAVPFILYDNIFESGTLSASSEASGFDVENVIDWRTYIRWEATAASSQVVTCDFGSPVSCDALGISGHNLSGAELAVHSSDTGSFSGEEVVRLALFTQPDNLPVCKSFTSASARYWRLAISSPSITPEIGVLCIGPRLDFPKNPNRPLSFVDESMEATSRRSKNGHILGATTYYRPYTTVLSFSWLLISFVQGDLYTFWDIHGSKLKPFFLQVNID